ncbi:MAG: FtsX-like permease family protein, partial [Vicinamibacteria bacterium]
ALIQSLEPAEVDVHIRTLEEIRHEVFANADAVIALFAVFAGFAFAMASMGIYGVMSYAVAQRERELGIRMALGADRGDLLRMVSLQGARLIFLGTLAGIAGAFFLSRMLSGFLLGGTLSDPATFVSVTVLLILVALFANWIPARRATRIDPISTLRAE